MINALASLRSDCCRLCVEIAVGLRSDSLSAFVGIRTQRSSAREDVKQPPHQLSLRVFPRDELLAARPNHKTEDRKCKESEARCQRRKRGDIELPGECQRGSQKEKSKPPLLLGSDGSQSFQF